MIKTLGTKIPMKMENVFLLGTWWKKKLVGVGWERSVGNMILLLSFLHMFNCNIMYKRIFRDSFEIFSNSKSDKYVQNKNMVSYCRSLMAWPIRMWETVKWPFLRKEPRLGSILKFVNAKSDIIFLFLWAEKFSHLIELLAETYPKPLWCSICPSSNLSEKNHWLTS